jgi:hypothetical protein
VSISAHGGARDLTELSHEKTALPVGRIQQHNNRWLLCHQNDPSAFIVTRYYVAGSPNSNPEDIDSARDQLWRYRETAPSNAGSGGQINLSAQNSAASGEYIEVRDS